MTTPPHNRDAEEALLACAWHNPALTTTLGIQPSDLYGTDTEALWHTLTTLNNEGTQPDPVVTLQRIPKQLRPAVNDLILHIAAGHPAIGANAPAYAAEILTLARRRRILTATDRLHQLLDNPDTTDQTLTDALTQLDQATTPTEAGRATQTALDRYPALNLAELLDPNRPPREFVIEGLLPARASTALVAPAGTAKSLLALGISIAVSQGHRRFAGFDVPRQRHVLYIDMENTLDDLAERFEDYGLGPNHTLDGLTYLSLPRLPYLDTPEGGTELAAILDAYQLQPGDLVILDSLQRVIEGEENKADTLRAFYANAGIELKRRGLSVLRLDNTGKDTTKGSRGTSSKRDDVDLELVMVRDADDPHKFHIEVTKGRLGDFATKIVLTRDPDAPTITWSTGGDPFRSYVNECKTALDQLGLAHDTGERPAYDAVRAAGRKFTRQVVRAAVKERKGRSTTTPNTPDQVRRDPSAHPVQTDRAADPRRTPAHPTQTTSETPSQTENHTAPSPNGAPRRTPSSAAAPSARRSIGTAQQRGANEKSTNQPPPDELPNLPTCTRCGNPVDPGRRLCHQCAQAEAIAHHQQKLTATTQPLPPLPNNYGGQMPPFPEPPF